jgi:hypothetical protein
MRMVTRGARATRTDVALRIVPANEAPWEDVERVLGKARCHGALCYCQRFKIPHAAWRATTDEERVHRPREQTVGSRSVFAAAGFREVARPTLRRVVNAVAWTAAMA